jgi:hypothetical protein
MINVIVFPPGEVQAYLSVPQYGNVVLLVILFSGVSNFTTLKLLSLIFSQNFGLQNISSPYFSNEIP